MSNKRRSKLEEVGFITVDAGIVYVGDPCYQSQDNSDFKDWDKFCEKLEDHKDVTVLNHEKGPGKGLIVSSGYGDGIYPVYVKRDKDTGAIVELVVKF